MARLDHLDDAALLSRAHADAAAFGIFYRRHAETLLTFLVRRSGSVETGADLIAETFASALVHGQVRTRRAASPSRGCTAWRATSSPAITGRARSSCAPGDAWA